MGLNAKGELGLGDEEMRKEFVLNEELSDKFIEEVAIGKGGFVIAIGQLQPVQPQPVDQSLEQ